MIQIFNYNRYHDARVLGSIRLIGFSAMNKNAKRQNKKKNKKKII